jgi:hypothetical protein
MGTRDSRLNPLRAAQSKLKEAKAKAAPATASKAAPTTAPAPKGRAPVSDDDDMPGLVSSDDEDIKPQPAKPPQQPQPAQSSAKKVGCLSPLHLSC